MEIITGYCIVKFAQWGYDRHPIFSSEDPVSSLYTILDNETLLHITGPDSLTFLQGQTTCDTSTVDSNHAILGAYCTPKGRVVCDFLLCQLDDNHYALRLRRDIVHHSAATFGKYIVFSKADLRADDESWSIYGCWGDEAGTALKHALNCSIADAGSQEQYSSCGGDGFMVIQTDHEGKQYECYINTASHPELIEKLASAMSPGDADHWLALQIDQGVARIEAATAEVFIPQVLNYDLTGHISFSKGCYTGQEVVARMHYRGKPKQRLFKATMDECAVLQAGTPLYTAQSQQSAGTVVNGALNSDGLPICLVVAPIALEDTVIHLSAPNGPNLFLDISPDNTG